MGRDFGVARDVLYAEYDKWREDNGHHRMSKTKFGQALMAAEPSVDVRRPGGRGNQIWWCSGIKLAGRQPSVQIGEKVVLLRPSGETAAPPGAA